MFSWVLRCELSQVFSVLFLQTEKEFGVTQVVLTGEASALEDLGVEDDCVGAEQVG